ncbi:unnamed protein product [Diamesa serratosioi]
MTMWFKKSTKMADEFRTEGNRYYDGREYLNALIYYNMSLCYAEKGSESLGIAFANRASVYLESNLFRICLKNIQLARAHNYPESKKKTLDDRELKCRDLMKIHPDEELVEKHWDYFKLSYPANKKYPHITDCLEVKSDEKYGRYIITNKDLKVGDIVSIEEPFCHVSFGSVKRYTYCVNCCKKQLLDLFPCPDCVTTMFCSEECKHSAMKSFHYYECRHQKSLSQLSKHFRFAYRLLFKALSIFDGSVEDFERFINENKDSKVTIFDLDFSDPDNIENDKNRLLIMIALNDHDESYYKKSCRLIKDVLLDILPGRERTCRYFLNRVKNMLKFHSQSISSWSMVKGNCILDSTDLNSLGTYLFSALVNHSCIPNVQGIHIENRIVMYVKRPIPQGHQLLECYNTLYINSTKDERQRSLLNNYKFICDCEACVEDYPTFDKMRKVGGDLNKYAMNHFNKLGTLTESEAEDKYKEHCELIQKQPYLSNTYEGAIIHDCILGCLMRLLKSFQFQ